MWPIARYAPVEHLDDLGEQLGFIAFQNDADAPPELAFEIGGVGGGGDAVVGKLAAGAEAAVQLIEISGGPISKLFRMPRDEVLDERVGRSIELPRQNARDRLEQLVDRNAEAGGQLVQRAGMRMRDAAGEATERALVERRGLYHVIEREVVAGHEAAQVAGHDCGVAVDRWRGSHQKSMVNKRKMAIRWL